MHNSRTIAQKQTAYGKLLSPRHKHHSKRGCNALEKAIETKVRREGKRACQEY